MEVREYLDIDYDIWQDFVLEYGNLYHDIRWKSIIEESYGLKSKYLLILSKNILVGILPLFYVGRNKILSIPYNSYSGLTISKYVDVDIVLENIMSFLKLNKIRKVSFRQLTSFQGAFLENDYVTMIKKLEETEELAFANFHYKQKNMIRSAYKEPFSLKKSDVDEYYPIYLKATNALGTPAHKKKYFENIAKYFGDTVRINILKHNNLSIGVIFEIDYKNIRYDLWAFSLKKYNKLKPNVYMYWETLKSSISDKLDYYDFGRSIYGGATFKFKKKWNAMPEKLVYREVETFSDIEILQLAKSGGFLPRVWMKLPNYITNNVGPILRKYIY